MTAAPHKATAPEWKAVQRDTLRTAELPEGAEIHVRVAGPFVRSLALLFDLIIILLGMVLVAVCADFLLVPVFGANVAEGVNMLGMFFLMWFYFVIFETGKHGASPGKRRNGLRVCQLSGAPVTLTQSITRNFIRFVDFLPALFGVGFIAMLCNRNFQRLGDIAAGTLVVYTEERTATIASLNDIAPTPPAVPLSRDEQLAILGFADRRARWSAERSDELARNLDALTNNAPTGDADNRTDAILGVASWIQRSRQS